MQLLGWDFFDWLTYGYVKVVQMMPMDLHKTFKVGRLTNLILTHRSRQAVLELLDTSDAGSKILVIDIVQLGKEVVDALFSYGQFGKVLIISTPVLKSYWETKMRQFNLDGLVSTFDDLSKLNMHQNFIESVNLVYIDELPQISGKDFNALTAFWLLFGEVEFVQMSILDSVKDSIGAISSAQDQMSIGDMMDHSALLLKPQVSRVMDNRGQMVIRVKLMGKPDVLFDGQPVFFKYQKAEAIFYYLSVYQKVERSRIMSIFWPDQSEDKARKNLRNALYSIRQAFKTDVLTTSGQRIIGFSDEVSLETDWQYANEDVLEGNTCIFLDSFTIKETLEFDQWVEHMREELQALKLEKLHLLLNQALKNKGDVEGLAKAIIKLEPYDEETCRILMRYYIEHGQQGKCLEVYGRLSRVLEEELSLKPEQETEQLLKQGIEGRKIQIVQGSKKQDFFYGRQLELNEIEAFVVSKRAEKSTGLILVTGEAGIGKSSVIRHVLERELFRDTFRIRIACNEGDEHHFMKSWYPILLKMGELILQKDLAIGSHQRDVLSRVFPTFMNAPVTGIAQPMEKQDLMPLAVIIHMVVEVLLNLVESVSVVLTIEDLQWMDPWGLELLKALAIETKTERLLLIGSYRKTTNKALNLFESEIERHHRTLNVYLERFTAGDTEGFIDEYPGRPQLDSAIRHTIFKESDGNALILTEILKDVVENGHYEVIPSRVKTLFSGRYHALSLQARKLADLMSAFFEPPKWEEISHLSLLSEVELLDIIEELMGTGFVHEIEIQDEVAYSFSHHKLKEYIYNQQSVTKRKLLHKRIGDYYREQLTGGLKDRLFYPRLVQHFERSGDKKAHLEYRIRSIYDYLEISHELFPMIKYRHLFDNIEVYQITDDFVVREIATIGRLMETIAKDETTIKLELEYLNMIGRYEVVQGNVESGCQYLRKMIQWAERENYSEFILKGYLQLIFNAINQRDIAEMEALLKSALQMVKGNVNKGEMGVIIRLKGYLMILKNKYTHGETLLQSAARIFERSEYRERYGLNRVATIYYLGESRRLQNDYEGAVKWYREAESLCNALGFTGHLALILSAKGVAAYDNGRFEESAKQLESAVKLYDSLHFKWGQISTYAYWSLMCLRNRDFGSCLLYLKKADRLTQAFDHAYERGLMLRIKAEICCLLKTMGGDDNLERYLNLPHFSYCQDALNFFETHTNFTYEEKVLADLKKVCGQCALYQ